MVLTAIVLVCVFVPKCHGIRELQRKKALLNEENRKLDQATKDLRLKRERFQSEPAFVERVAREAGMVRMDEIVFKFTNSHEDNTERVIQ